MTPDECITQIRLLLERYPGVSVVSASHNCATCKSYVRLSIVVLQSFVRIVHHCQAGANVRVSVSGAGATIPKGKPVNESLFRYSMVFPDDDGRGNFDHPPAPIQIFGGFLARDLKGLGLMANNDAETLLSKWGMAE